MLSPADRLLRLRWMAVPIVVYIAITLVLPIANGAAARANFLHHAGSVLVGCIAVVGLAVAGGLGLELARLGIKRISGARAR